MNDGYEQDWGRMMDMNRNCSNYFCSRIQMMMRIIKTEDEHLSCNF
jgi:hypothetical protein